MKRKGSSSSSKRRTALARVTLTVRLPEEVINKIDKELDQRDIPLSRNNWLLEAAIEKLRKNGSGGSNGAQ
jgi:hypothetical protein